MKRKHTSHHHDSNKVQQGMIIARHQTQHSGALELPIGYASCECKSLMACSTSNLYFSNISVE